MVRRQNFLTEKELAIANETPFIEAVTYYNAVELFMADANRKGLREFTIAYYRRECNDFRNYLLRIDHSLLIHEVMRNHIDGFVEYLQHERQLKNGSINTKLRAIRTFFNYLHRTKHIKDNPMEKYPLLKVRKGSIETFNTKQLRQLLNAPDKRTFIGQRDYTYLLLLVSTGIRLNEAVGILVEDVKLSESTLFVRNTKNHFHRYVPIHPKMKEQLRRYIKIRGISETEYLFVTLDNEPMTRSALQKIVRQYGELVGITGVRCSPHTLRHTFAKMSVMNGAGIFELQKILGHSTMEMVRTYVNLFSNELSEKYKEFSPLNKL